MWQKRDHWGDLSAPKATLDSSFLSSLSGLINDSEWIIITNYPNHFKSAFGSAYFKPKKGKLKLVRTVKKEPRKARFPWDIGLMFVQPIKYAMILQNIKFYNSERKSNACDLQVFFKNHAKKRTISLQLDLGCLWNFFKWNI